MPFEVVRVVLISATGSLITELSPLLAECHRNTLNLPKKRTQPSRTAVEFGSYSENTRTTALFSVVHRNQRHRPVLLYFLSLCIINSSGKEIQSSSPGYSDIASEKCYYVCACVELLNIYVRCGFQGFTEFTRTRTKV